MPGGAPALAVTDSRSSSYSLLNSDVNVYVYAATLASSGSDTVTVTDSSGTSAGLWVYVFEVSGVTTALAQTATGDGSCSGCSISTSSSVAFSPGAFLFAAMKCNNGCTFSPGAGFTLYNPSDGQGIVAEYATSGVSSPTDFPASWTSTTSDNWNEVGVALQPTAGTTTSSKSTTTSSTTSSSTTSTVSATPTRTTVSCSPSDIDRGHQTTCTATVTNRPSTSTSGGAPTGRVSFSSSSPGGTFSVPSCRTTSSGALKCTATYTPAATGKQTITATYRGDVTHAPSEGTTTVTVYR